MTGQRILIVDDEAPIRRLLRGALERAGYRVVEAQTARDALALVNHERPEAILLDLGLPDRDGIELIPLLKTRSTAALLVVSAREGTDEKVAALDLGADDYVTKPFDSDELLARVRAALRGRMAAQGAHGPVQAGDVTIDLARHIVTRAGAEVHLTRKEYEVLTQLALAPGRVVIHKRILDAAWPHEHDKRVEYLRSVIRQLRQKLEEDPARPAIIVNEMGIGYRLMGQ
ncbi:response regulator [Sphingomonas changnyeongensis]|uniref:Response regulator n=1 Tax=Sphingomonas changnyeongensis TaxID=2698679 RepID=A0A7Z2S4W7_9SPHN|nr:response regulator transcription factor [Sphingomonas changnyeongensis]QHL90495.1 response regulator [Sphingomonas changnyeongensis]